MPSSVYNSLYASRVPFVGGTYLPICLPVYPGMLPYYRVYVVYTLSTVFGRWEGSREPSPRAFRNGY